MRGSLTIIAGNYTDRQTRRKKCDEADKFEKFGSNIKPGPDPAEDGLHHRLHTLESGSPDSCNEHYRTVRLDCRGERQVKQNFSCQHFYEGFVPQPSTCAITLLKLHGFSL